MNGELSRGAGRTTQPWPTVPERAVCARVARLAVGCLYQELSLYPKPGLVSLVDNGSHPDMTAETFMRSMFALRHYFGRICRAGMEDAPFARLKELGVEAEARMLAATSSINTHRGAIFSLGLLCAAIGRSVALSLPLTPTSLRTALVQRWGGELAGHCAASDATSNGLRAALLHSASGAREEAALGLPSVFEVGLPTMHATLTSCRSMHEAKVDTLFALMAHMSDTNVYHRGGLAGAAMVREHARAFLGAGGTANPHWEKIALDCHRQFVANRLSPGGAADLLAATCLVHAVTTGHLA
jgi:triphosphoribosyl-dephospho-CoA synthase